MLVPNSQLLERKVVNWTLVDLDIRSTVRVGVAYGSPTEEVADLIQQAVGSVPGISKTPAPQVIFEDFGDSALIFDAYFWAEMRGEKDQRLLRSDVRFRIDQLFRDNGITIAFPQQDIHFDSTKPIEIRMRGVADNDSDNTSR